LVHVYLTVKQKGLRGRAVFLLQAFSQTCSSEALGREAAELKLLTVRTRRRTRPESVRGVMRTYAWYKALFVVGKVFMNSSAMRG
jgi:hypothetical protein